MPGDFKLKLLHVVDTLLPHEIRTGHSLFIAIGNH